ncbi:uncharacterized protein LOC117321606 isoform X2 [Pecten maximus]|uniref:uncharacterized protein LOC117321606 isoform X2 n=1 Tax=Pecten maximus TaxID=6579 RepID=UPI00145870C0|nr:uncharacterized protein LOC117321606 isoform X2 [Pecten maximus]
MEKIIILLLVVVVVVSQAQSQKPSSRSGRLQQSGRRSSGRSGRPSQGAVLSKPASAATGKPSGAKLTAKLVTAPEAKSRPLGAKLKAGNAQVTTKSATSGSPKTKCKGRCKFPNEVCVRKARCAGPSCFFCAETNSIPKLPGKKPTPKPAVDMSPRFNSMPMNGMGMYGMQQQPTDFFSDLFGLGPSTGGFDIFGTRQQQVVRQPVSSGFPNSFFPRNPLTSVPVAGDSPFNQMDYSQPFSGNSQSAAGSMTNSNSAPFLRGPSQMTSPMLPTFNLMRESPAMDRTSGLANLFGGLFGGGGSGGMSGGNGMNFLSMGMLGIDPFQLF